MGVPPAKLHEKLAAPALCPRGLTRLPFRRLLPEIRWQSCLSHFANEGAAAALGSRKPSSSSSSYTLLTVMGAMTSCSASSRWDGSLSPGANRRSGDGFRDLAHQLPENRNLIGGIDVELHTSALGHYSTLAKRRQRARREWDKVIARWAPLRGMALNTTLARYVLTEQRCA
jgi:hypothetical protein